MFKRTVILAAAALVALSGCVSLGVSQQDSETTYTLAATGADVALLSGQVNGVSAGQICLVDMANYRVMSATRNVGDNVNYQPADAAHAALQRDGARLNPAQCNVGTP